MSQPEIAEIAADQWGMITTSQASAVGVSAQVVARLANSGTLERIAHGVYRLAGTPPHPQDDLRAAWLALDPRHTAGDRLTMEPVEAVSHRSAALLHQLGDVDADILEFTAARRRQPRRSDIRIHRGTLEPDAWTLVDGLPVTTPLRTISDLASARLDRGHLAGVVRDAIVQHDLPIAAVAAVLNRHAGSYGTTKGDGINLVEVMLDEVGVPASTLDIAAHLRGAARRSLADALIKDGMPGDLVRRNVDTLAASGITDVIARMNAETLRNSGILEAIVTTSNPAFASLLQKVRRTIAHPDISNIWPPPNSGEEQGEANTDDESSEHLQAARARATRPSSANGRG